MFCFSLWLKLLDVSSLYSCFTNIGNSMQIKAVLTKPESVTKSCRETSLYNCAFSFDILKNFWRSGVNKMIVVASTINFWKLHCWSFNDTSFSQTIAFILVLWPILLRNTFFKVLLQQNSSTEIKIICSLVIMWFCNLEYPLPRTWRPATLESLGIVLRKCWPRRRTSEVSECLVK